MTPELTEAMRLADGTPWGAACSARWLRALELARAERDDAAEIACHLELVRARVQEGAATKMIAPFLWLAERCREGALTPEQTTEFGWHYRHAVAAMIGVPAVPLRQIEEMLDRMATHHRRHGGSLRPVHALRRRLALTVGDDERAEEEYRRWYAAAPGGDLGNCPGCDPLVEIAHARGRGDWEGAYRTGKAALDADGPTCASQPEATLVALLEPMLRTGRDDEAWAAHLRAYRTHQAAPDAFASLGQHFRYLALSGAAGRPERLGRGRRLLLQHASWWTSAETPLDLFDVSAAALLLLHALPDDPGTVLPVTLPGADIEWAPQPTLHEPTLAEAREWLRRLAEEIAAAMDARSGRPVYAGRLRALLAPEPVPPLPAVAVPDVSGMSEPDASDYRIAGSPVPPPAPADPDETPPLPVTLDGPWRRMTVPELLRAAHELGPRTPSVFQFAVQQRIFAGETEPDGLDDACAAQWRAACDEVRTLLASGDEAPRFEGSPDRAHRMLGEAGALRAAGEFAECAGLAYEAMRTDTADPLGVRLRGLAEMGWAALHAGYPDDAVDSFRQAINLAAACGFDVHRAKLSAGLAEALEGRDRDLEAADVAEAALALLAQHAAAGVTLDLRRTLALALRGLGHHDQAGRQFAASARAASDEETALELWERARRAFDAAGDAAGEIEASRYVVDLLEAGFDGADPEHARMLVTALERAAAALAAQPEVSDADVDAWERLAAREREVLHLPGVSEVGPEVLEARWLRDVGWLYWQSDRRMLAIDHLRAAGDAFGAAGRRQEQATTLRMLAEAHALRDEVEQARDVAQAGLALLDTVLDRHSTEAAKLRRILEGLPE